MRDFIIIIIIINNLKQISEKSAHSDACGPRISKWFLKFLWVLNLNLELHSRKESPGS